MGENIRARRKELGMTQAEVARAAGVSVNSYQLYERAARMPSVTNALRVAEVLKSSVYELWSAPQEAQA